MTNTNHRVWRWLCSANALLASLAIGCGEDEDPPAKQQLVNTGGSTGGSGESGGSGGSLGGSGGSGDTGGSAGSGVMVGAGTGGSSGSGKGGSAGEDGPFVPPTCNPKGGLPDDAPELEPGVWKDITPKGSGIPVPSGDTGTKIFTQGMAIDPCNPATLYVTVSGFDDTSFVAGGLFRSTNAGTDWEKLGPFDQAINVRVDPRDPLHLYVGDGVRGDTKGFWVSHDGGETWAMPDGFIAAADSVHDYDVYHVEPDPNNFDHVLVTFHYYWNYSEDANAGIFESFDGGDTWTLHQPHPDWSGAGGYNVFFLYNPEQKIGNSKTWLYGTQGKGYWRTEDSGENWTQVSEIDMQHGGGTLYYNPEGVLYTGGYPNSLRSRDNGKTWENIGPPGGFLTITGDGTTLYQATLQGPSPIMVAREDDDTNWGPYMDGAQVFDTGPFELVFDKLNRILYAPMTNEGVWALKVTE